MGVGSFLMEQFENAVVSILGEIPPITLECTGSVGLGKNAQETPVKEQTKFFEQFGYQITSVSSDEDYIQMSKTS